MKSTVCLQKFVRVIFLPLHRPGQFDVDGRNFSTFNEFSVKNL